MYVIRLRVLKCIFVLGCGRDIPEGNIFAPTCEKDQSKSVMYLIPVRIFSDPFTLDPNKLALCEVLQYNRLPAGKTETL